MSVSPEVPRGSQPRPVSAALDAGELGAEFTELIFDDFVGHARKNVVASDQKEPPLPLERVSPFYRRDDLLVRSGARIDHVG